MALIDENVCDNATYEHRVDDPSTYNYCAVPRSGYDVRVLWALAGAA